MIFPGSLELFQVFSRNIFYYNMMIQKKLSKTSRVLIYINLYTKNILDTTWTNFILKQYFYGISKTNQYKISMAWFNHEIVFHDLSMSFGIFF